VCCGQWIGFSKQGVLVTGLAIIIVLIMPLYILYIAVLVHLKCILKGGNCGIVTKRIDVCEIP
jgi:hypothetical protein